MTESFDPAAAERWRAAGVRHALLLRVLPALRHDLATPISVVRMTALVLQRKLSATPVDADYCLGRVAALDRQSDALTQALQWLLGWSLGSVELEVTRPLLVSDCVELLRPLWALEGVAIEVDARLLLPPDAAAHAPAATAGAPRTQQQHEKEESRWPRQTALRYLLLGALCYLHDTGAGLARLQIAPDRHDALQLRRIDRGTAGAAEAQALTATCLAEQREEPVCIDMDALACLAVDLGYHMRCSDDSVWLQLAAERPAGSEFGSRAVRHAVHATKLSE